MAKAKGGSTTSMKVSFGKKSKGKAKKKYGPTELLGLLFSPIPFQPNVRERT